MIELDVENLKNISDFHFNQSNFYNESNRKDYTNKIKTYAEIVFKNTNDIPSVFYRYNLNNNEGFYILKNDGEFVDENITDLNTLDKSHIDNSWYFKALKEKKLYGQDHIILNS